MIKKTIACSWIMLLLLLPLASSVSTIDVYKNPRITIERGGEHTVYLPIRSLTGVTTITATGDASGWVVFTENLQTSVTITNLIDQSLLVKIMVPDTAEIKDYNVTIAANGGTLSILTISVVRPFNDRLDDLESRLGYIEEWQQDLEAELNSLISNQNVVLTGHVNEILKKLGEAVDSQRNISNVLKEMGGDIDSQLGVSSSIESQLEDLRSVSEQDNQQARDRMEQLERELSESDVTGSLSLGSSAFWIGVIVGVLAFVLVTRVLLRRGRNR